MAKQAGPIKFEGTIGNLTGYQVNGKYYLKMKTSVSRKRILKAPEYINTRRNAERFARAQKLAARVYRQLKVPELDHKGIWYPLRNRAQELVRKEVPAGEIIRLLTKEFIEPVKNRANKKKVVKAAPVTEPTVKTDEILNEIFLGKTANKGLEYKLADQLAAGHILLTRLLDKARKDDIFKTERQVLAGTLKKFRR